MSNLYVVCIYLYMSRLGMQLAQYGEGHTVVLYARATRAARPPGVARSFITTRRSFITQQNGRRFTYHVVAQRQRHCLMDGMLLYSKPEMIFVDRRH